MANPIATFETTQGAENWAGGQQNGGSPLQNYSGWWFGTWLLFSPIVGMMIQSD
jgi:uncharacterized membrane protein